MPQHSRFKVTVARLALLFSVCFLPSLAPAQDRSHSMTDAEIEQVRELSYQPNDRVALFQKFLDQRIADIQKINAAKRVNDRENLLHDLMDQFSALADELDDNLDDYQQKHWDVRKALRKLAEDSGKWAAILNQPPPDPAYNVTRKLALEAATDIHDSAQKVLEDQTAWFAAHPPVKEEEKGPVIIPR